MTNYVDVDVVCLQLSIVSLFAFMGTDHRKYSITEQELDDALRGRYGECREYAVCDRDKKLLIDSRCLKPCKCNGETGYMLGDCGALLRDWLERQQEIKTNIEP